MAAPWANSTCGAGHEQLHEPAPAPSWPFPRAFGAAALRLRRRSPSIPPLQPADGRGLPRYGAALRRDGAEGYGRVELPGALSRKFPGAGRDWRWQFVSPQHRRWVNSKTGEQGRHPIDESIVQRAVARAVREAGPGAEVTAGGIQEEYRRDTGGIGGSRLSRRELQVPAASHFRAGACSAAQGGR